MKNTKFTCVILITLLSINCLFGCGSQKQKPDFSSIKSVCELSTLKCYYHNVATYEKNAHGLLKVFGSGYNVIFGPEAEVDPVAPPINCSVGSPFDP